MGIFFMQMSELEENIALKNVPRKHQTEAATGEFRRNRKLTEFRFRVCINVMAANAIYADVTVISRRGGSAKTATNIQMTDTRPLTTLFQ